MNVINDRSTIIKLHRKKVKSKLIHSAMIVLAEAIDVQAATNNDTGLSNSHHKAIQPIFITTHKVRRLENDPVQDAAIRNIETIGETSHKIEKH